VPENEEPEQSLEMRVAALEDKLAGLTFSQDELETYQKVMKVDRILRARRALRRSGLSRNTLLAEGGCISGCISPCDCSDCGCIEGCIDARAEGGCISGCISPCSCSDCGCIEGCIDAASSRSRRRSSSTSRRFRNFGRLPARVGTLGAPFRRRPGPWTMRNEYGGRGLRAEAAGLPEELQQDRGKILARPGPSSAAYGRPGESPGGGRY
jgi:hypothetical protein